MGDSFQSLVLPETDAEKAVATAARLTDWLVAGGIAQKGSGANGFSPGPQAEAALAEQQPGWREIAFTDIHVDSCRVVNSAAQGGLGPVFCPACGSAMGNSESVPPTFIHAADEWYRGLDGILECPACKTSSPITKWRTEPHWAFGDITITFWNWPPIRDAFVREVERMADQRVKVVRGKI